jgi:hypothetical protein
MTNKRAWKRYYTLNYSRVFFFFDKVLLSTLGVVSNNMLQLVNFSLSSFVFLFAFSCFLVFFPNEPAREKVVLYFALQRVSPRIVCSLYFALQRVSL